MIGSRKGVDHGEGHAILGENEGSSHRRPPNLVPIEHPSNGKTRKFAIEMSLNPSAAAMGLGALRSE